MPPRPRGNKALFSGIMVVKNPLKRPDFLRGMVLRGVPLDSQYPCLLVFLFTGLHMLNIHRFNHWLVGGSSLWFDYCNINSSMKDSENLRIGRLSEQTEYNIQNIRIFFANEPEILWLTPHLSVNLSSTQWSFENKTHIFLGGLRWKSPNSPLTDGISARAKFERTPMRLANVRHRDASRGPLPNQQGKHHVTRIHKWMSVFVLQKIPWKKSIGKTIRLSLIVDIQMRLWGLFGSQIDILKPRGLDRRKYISNGRCPMGPRPLEWRNFWTTGGLHETSIPTFLPLKKEQTRIFEVKLDFTLRVSKCFFNTLWGCFEDAQKNPTQEKSVGIISKRLGPYLHPPLCAQHPFAEQGSWLSNDFSCLSHKGW